MGVRRTPMRIQPNKTSTNSARFLHIIATESPATSPCASITFARRLAFSCSCKKLRLPCAENNAVLCGFSRANTCDCIHVWEHSLSSSSNGRKSMPVVFNYLSPRVCMTFAWLLDDMQCCDYPNDCNYWHRIIALYVDFSCVQIGSNNILTYSSVWNSIIDYLYNSCHVEFSSDRK
jgi:hypothetical protein